MSYTKELLKGSAAVVVGSCIMGPLGAVAAVWATHKFFPPADDTNADTEGVKLDPEEAVAFINKNQVSLGQPARQWLMEAGYKQVVSEGRTTWVLK